MEKRRVKRAGIDIGGFLTKVATGGNVTSFLSAVGERFSGFGLGDVDGIQFENPACVVGENAVKFSRFAQHQQERDWYKGELHQRLFYAALSEVTSASCDLFIVSGTPAKYWTSDGESFKQVLTGSHTFQRVSRRTQTVNVSARVLAQGVGALFNVLMDKNGTIRNEKLACSHLGVIEVGSRTTNIIHMNELQMVDHETDTYQIGGWDMVNVLRDALTNRYSRIAPDDFQVEKYMREGAMMYEGKRVDITPEINHASALIASQILASVNNKWKSAGSMELILITGGSSHQIGKALSTHFPQSQIDSDPVNANAKGYDKYAQRFEE